MSLSLLQGSHRQQTWHRTIRYAHRRSEPDSPRTYVGTDESERLVPPLILCEVRASSPTNLDPCAVPQSKTTNDRLGELHDDWWKFMRGSRREAYDRGFR